MLPMKEINGLKKILKNRTYLGEVKFAGNLYKSNHPAIINPEIFLNYRL